MTLPASWAQIPVTGRFIDSDGNLLTGTVTFRSAQVVVAEDSVVIPKLHYASLVDGEIQAGFTLPSTNDPDIAPTGWAYTVFEDVGKHSRPPYAIFVPFDATSIDLATVAPVVPPPELVSTRGPAGNTLFAVFDIDPASGELSVTTPVGYTGPAFTINTQGYLGVSIV